MAGNKFIEEFNRNPTEENWKKFEGVMKKDKARYYYVAFPAGVKGKGSLKDAYAVIYNGQRKQLYKIPVMKKTKKGIEGATIHLMGLEVNRRAI